MSEKPEDKSGLNHLLKSSGARPFVPKTNKFDAELFKAKFVPSLIKTLQLKGIHMECVDAENSVIHAPQIQELPENILLLPFKNSLKKLGFIALSSEFVSELIHKMMGGSDKVAPGVLNYPLSTLQLKVVNSFDRALANCIREGIKVFLGLDTIAMQESLNLVESQALLEESGDYFVNQFGFSGLTDSSVTILLRVEAFNP